MDFPKSFPISKFLWIFRGVKTFEKVEIASDFYVQLYIVRHKLDRSTVTDKAECLTDAMVPVYMPFIKTLT